MDCPDACSIVVSRTADGRLKVRGNPDNPFTGGFLALRSPRAGALCDALRDRGVRTDVRGEMLRFGPAPYLSDRQVVSAMDALGEVLREG